MSNMLSIELTTFTQRGSDEKRLGFVVEDDYYSYYYRSYCATWEEFKKSFPTKESLFWAAVECEGLSDYLRYVHFENGEPVVEDEDAPISTVCFRGCEGLYD